ncbi:MAG: N-acetylneuraminate synthase family protein [Treponema sp.]|nr:N-acetylneuraminate synthase family protein [Treponema sp.]
MEIIAEIGTSHGGDLEKAKKLIDTAIDSGADWVKFQWVYADEILHPNTGYVKLPTGNIRLYDRFKELEVEPSFFEECARYTHEKGAKFTCTPFGLKSLEELMKINPDAIKIASPELNHIPLLKKLSEIRSEQKNAGKIPIKTIISSGVSKLSDIENAISILGTENVTLLHCITFYPAPEEEYNIKVIPNLSKIFGVDAGISDHSLDPVLVPSLAAAVGAKMIEKHITLSKETDGLDDPVALTGEQFALMHHCVRQCEAVFRQYGENSFDYITRQLKEEYGERVEKALGSGIKRLAASEEANYGRTNRSLHFMRDMKKGEKISEDDIRVLRTEKVLLPGLEPKFLDDIVGAVMARDAEDGKGVEWKDVISF